MTPDGISISEGGLEPDVVVEPEEGEVFNEESDRQIDRAIDVLLERN
jgi:C-terminal processing protease CtpA/Prc